MKLMNPEQTELAELASTINDAFENRETINTQSSGNIRDAVEKALDYLDREYRACC